MRRQPGSTQSRSSTGSEGDKRQAYSEKGRDGEGIGHSEMVGECPRAKLPTAIRPVHYTPGWKHALSALEASKVGK